MLFTVCDWCIAPKQHAESALPPRFPQVLTQRGEREPAQRQRRIASMPGHGGPNPGSCSRCSNR